MSILSAIEVIWMGTMNSFLKVVSSTVAAACLAGCSTIIEGTSQKIAITTSPPGSHCSLRRDGETIATLFQTPGEVTVDKTKDDILLNCAAAGYEPTSQYLHSGIATGTYGNIIAGGLVGWGVDSMTGADNEYPTAVNLTMRQLANGDIAVSSAQQSSVPCTKEESDVRLLSLQQGYRFTANCY
jgi:hypothetical protein